MVKSQQIPSSIAGYDVLRFLGEGAGSTIYAVQHPRTKQVYALKYVERITPDDQKYVDQAENEYKLASQLNHPGLRKAFRIIPIRRWFKKRGNIVILEMVNGRSLLDHTPSDLRTLAHIFYHASEALGALHKMGYVHSDVKPNNILATSAGKVKIIDFGQSCPLGTTKDRIQGTPEYMAPEQFYRGTLDQRTDIYNLAASFYWCIASEHIAMPTREQFQGNDLSTNINFEKLSHHQIAPQTIEKILLCLSPTPSSRPESIDFLTNLFMSELS